MKMATISAKRVREQPQMWLFQVPSAGFDHRPPPDCDDFLIRLVPNLFMARFRAVNISRLSTILKSGIDVEPTDSTFYADYFDKAWEYGGWPKVVLAFDIQKLRKTFTEIPANTAPEEIANLRRTFPTILPSMDGSKFWLSRLKETDPKLASGYEIAYAWWIDGDPFEALKGIFLFSRPQDASALEQFAS